MGTTPPPPTKPNNVTAKYRFSERTRLKELEVHLENQRRRPQLPVIASAGTEGDWRDLEDRGL